MNTTKYYQYKSGSIVCEPCYGMDLADTLKGRFKGDEAVRPEDVSLLEDWQTEAYQCDGCLEQNEAYEELENPDLDEG